MSGNLTGVAVLPLMPEALAQLPYPERSLEIIFARAAIEQPDGSHLVGPLHLRTSPMEAAVLALAIQDTITVTALAEARRLREHGHTSADTGVLTRVLSGLRELKI
ncbi:hypothetical protein LO772_23175 [Yinghuangia sp. ASG 101]|uniref:hypothetical protein n=1 Tax=Yinghuangia sp. ASG 101 TaxID=2896848 RepID=UPI001E354B22|nr:hypothetical protein [Yinghuangia sp. ASG 101]UGQ09794.1 hypothetical protein LO772_23175 [Yinghuangia sp. ASG 101]